MGNDRNQEATGDVCGLCQEPLADGETVLQIVEDRHPTYDKEIVLQHARDGHTRLPAVRLLVSHCLAVEGRAGPQPLRTDSLSILWNAG